MVTFPKPSFRPVVLKVGSPDPRGSAARCQGVREELDLFFFFFFLRSRTPLRHAPTSVAGPGCIAFAHPPRPAPTSVAGPGCIAIATQTPPRNIYTHIYRALKSHALGVRHTHFNPFTRSHAPPPPPPPRQQSRTAPPPRL